ncbi:MAG: hypothetical protein LKK36_01455 [Ewingella americana]|jgi:hypothetical protein|uniref:hypothetical protein n=1 Tax=Ewingella americana TaxID=41202 RepID=UPI00242FEEB8|nr:hypothetical protein [Ewingella americana]MCI1678090.1 hypothetical protein [Ewingella americana]MCI1856273.1 hypothetical protein [Ewingella americana]MCI1862498.1 hypothetical protein [Ewingella americana]MCI2162340.1 hypothetical protein [Ewingella americana]MCI2209211.1 hypothetical protein [Ewingella americana]
MAKRVDFDFLVAGIIQQEGLAALRPVVEKELLHYDILFCLSEAGLLKRLTTTIQGGYAASPATLRLGVLSAHVCRLHAATRHKKIHWLKVCPNSWQSLKYKLVLC